MLPARHFFFDHRAFFRDDPFYALLYRNVARTKPQSRIFRSHGAPFFVVPSEGVNSLGSCDVSLWGEGSLEQLPERSPHLMHTESRVFLRDRHHFYDRIVSVCILVMRERPDIGMCQRCDGGCCMLYFVVLVHFWLGSHWAPEKGKNGNKPLFCCTFFARWHDMACSFAFVNAVWWRCLEPACARAIFCCSIFALHYCSVKFSIFLL